jgi:hypothetical protein
VALCHNRDERTHILNNYNRDKPNANYLGLDILVDTTVKLGGGENSTGGN